MQVNNAQELYAQYKQETLAVNQFATLHMGMQAGLTALKVDSYVIACAPYRLSLSGATMVAVFSREELVFFQRYSGALAGLALVFQPGNSPQPMKIFARCTIKTITPMKGKDSIGLIVIEWKPCPPDLQTIIGDFFMLVDRLKVEYEDFKGKRIAINAESAKLMGFNNYSLIKYEGAETKAALFALASDKLEFLVPVQAPPMEIGKPATVKLFFQSYQFSLSATVSEAMKLPNGAQKLALTTPFSAELVDIIEHYRFSERFAVKPAAPGAPGASPEPTAG